MNALSTSAWLSLVDGKPVGTGECVALANDFCARVLGVPAPGTDGGTHPGYASSMYEAYSGTAFKKISPLAPMQPNDLPVWKFGSSVAPLSHVAVGLTDLGPAVLVESQNTNGHRYAEKTTLPKVGLLGYLRPVGGAGAGTVLASDLGDALGGGAWGEFLGGVGSSIAGGGNMADALTGGGAAALGSVVGTWGKVLSWLADPENWKRIGIALLGIILIMVALVKIAGMTGASDLVKKAIQ